MKKGIIFTTIILVVAAVLAVVFVTLFKERDTDAVADKVISVVDEGYLSEDTDKETIEEYLNYMRYNAGASTDEVQMSINFYNAYDKLGDFYREHIIFTSYNSTYRANRDDVIGGFNTATDRAEDMVDYIVSNTAGESESWEARTWDDVRVMMFEFIDANNRAFVALGNIYPACGNSLITNNDFTTAVLNGINKHLSDYQNADETTNKNQIATNVNNMVTRYLTDEIFTDPLVYDYLYNATWQSQIADLTTNGEQSGYYGAFMAGTL